MAEIDANQSEAPTRKTFTGMQVVGLIIGAMCLTILATAIALQYVLFPGPFAPVVLSTGETTKLEKKMAIFEGFGNDLTAVPGEHNQDGALKPERYSEDGNSRQITFTERELNALVAKNTDLATKLAIDLAENMISVKFLIPLDDDFPVLGGKTLKIKAGTELAYRDGRPVVKFRGISVMGVPLPSAWLGGIKNIDLIQEFGTDEGFWQTFAAGVESINITEGLLKIGLKE